MQTPRLFGVLALLLTLATQVSAAQDTDRWYEVWIEGARSGWSHERVTTEEGRITTRTEMRMVMGRSDQAVEITTESSFVETVEGEPVEMRVKQRFGPVPVDTVYEFREDGVLVRSSQAEAGRETVMPLPEGEWLPPAAAAEYVKKRLLSGATEITVRMLDPTNGLAVVTATRTGIAPAQVEVLGERVEGYRATSRTKVGPTEIAGAEWFDAEGAPVRVEMSLGAMRMAMVASTRERALEASEPAELMVSTFVKPDRPIPRPRASRRAVYTVSLDEGSLPAIPASAFQASESVDERTARVNLDLRARRGAADADAAAHLSATTYADCEDGLIKELTAEALSGAAEDDAARAEALRRFVYRHIKSKDLGVVFATASDTARSREGDCSEHGVLLAAMLRAAGIPSRVAAGVVYVDQFAGQRGVFGYHMWTQALLDGEDGPAWVDLDATLDDRTPFDAAHIAFATSSLAEGETVSALAGIAPLLGTLRIKVEEVD